MNIFIFSLCVQIKGSVLAFSTRNLCYKDKAVIEFRKIIPVYIEKSEKYLNIVTYRVVRVTKITGSTIVRIVGFISTFVTNSLSHT